MDKQTEDGQIQLSRAWTNLAEAGRVGLNRVRSCWTAARLNMISTGQADHIPMRPCAPAPRL